MTSGSMSRRGHREMVAVVGMLYAFVIVGLDRRDLVWINVTQNPTVEWIARQLTEAFPWDEAPGYLVRIMIASTAMSSCAAFALWVIAPSASRRFDNEQCSSVFD
jgi:hypothetical protein